MFEHAPIVRDHTDCDAQWIGPNGMRALLDAHIETIAAIPDELLQPALKQRRSGRYFEALLVALIEADDSLELLAHDLQIQDEKRTIGAFDLLVRCAGNPTVTHLELAFKQYLYRGGDATKAAQWVGPRGRDRLNLKAQHMRDHQLMLGKTTAGQAALKARGIDAVTSRALMAGRLFFHRHDFLDGQLPDFPSTCSDTPELGWWCTEQELDDLTGSNSDWRALPPNYAISPLNTDDCQTLSAPDWLDLQQLAAAGHPSLIAEVCDGVEMSRGWIVRATET